MSLDRRMVRHPALSVTRMTQQTAERLGLGEVQVWLDGISVINVTGLVLRSTKEAIFQGMHFETFFGGMWFHYHTSVTIHHLQYSNPPSCRFYFRLGVPQRTACLDGQCFWGNGRMMGRV